MYVSVMICDVERQPTVWTGENARRLSAQLHIYAYTHIPTNTRERDYDALLNAKCMCMA